MVLLLFYWKWDSYTIRNSYQQYKHFLQTPQPSMSSTKFVVVPNNEVGKLIDEIGYLDIVSLYIKRKGFRDSIANYIEEKTPILSEDETHLEFNVDGKAERELLTDETLSLHRTLLMLPWNNLYTTNYDEMLESAINIDKEKISEPISKNSAVNSPEKREFSHPPLKQSKTTTITLNRELSGVKRTPLK